MVDFQRRSTVPEYMDYAMLDGDEVVTVLNEIEYVNRFLGGINATREALNHLLPAADSPSFSLLDLGTGSADIPIAMVHWARQRGMAIEITAVDFNPTICEVARQRTAAYAEITVLEADVFDLAASKPFDTATTSATTPQTFDVVHGAMFLHHFSQSQAATILRLMSDLCRHGIIVNDLHRHPLAYYSILGLGRLLSLSPMFRHDAPTSVLRGFQRSDLAVLGDMSGLTDVDITWRWPFRYVMTARKRRM